MVAYIYHEQKLPNGRTIKEDNLLTLSHKIPLKALVEVNISYSDHHGIRAFVCEHTRDCDGTPLYALCMTDDFETLHYVKQENYAVYRAIIEDGFSDDCLTVIRYPKNYLLKLSDYADVKFDLRVISAKGTPGVVMMARDMTPDEIAQYRSEKEDDMLIAIGWDDGGTSIFPKSQLEAVTVDPSELTR